jgi:hypothetical protein
MLRCVPGLISLEGREELRDVLVQASLSCGGCLGRARPLGSAGFAGSGALALAVTVLLIRMPALPTSVTSVPVDDVRACVSSLAGLQSTACLTWLAGGKMSGEGDCF